MSLGALDYAIIVVYLLLMIGIGALVATRIKGFKDYFLAGGMLTTPLLICTLVSTYYGLDVTFGTSESGFYYGLSAYFWYSVPYYLFIAVAALVLATRLKRFNFMSLPDVLEHHYGIGTRMLGAFACFVYSMPILAVAGILTTLEMLGLPTVWGLIVTVSACGIYTMIGGLWADAISDTVQFVLMCVTVAMVLPGAVEWAGGWDFVEHLPGEHMTGDGGLSYWMLAAWAGAGLTVLVEPAFYQRIFAAKDKATVVRALIIGIVLWAAYDWGVVVLGMVGRAAVEHGLLPLNADEDGHKALLAVSMQMLPLGLRGLFLGGILSAAMSTIDTYSLLASSNLVYDIYHPLTGRRLSDRQLMQRTRIGIFIVLVTAALAGLLFERLRDAWLFMASVLTAVVLVPVLAALFMKPTRLAGLLGAAGGLLGLVTFYGVLFTLGEKDPEEAAYVLRLGDVELWQDCAAIVALPVSAIAFTVGQIFGRRSS